MHAVMSESIKRRIILELREFWSTDPKYRDSLTHNIQGKYSFDQRPQQAIIVKGASMSPIRFSADHYQGMVVSYCHLTKALGKLGSSVEWVREDARSIQKNQGLFPSPPGIYYVEVLSEPDQSGSSRLVFYVDPLLSKTGEITREASPTLHTTSNGGFQPGSLSVWEMPGNLFLYEGTNYTSDPQTGEITLVEPLPSGTHLSVDYYYAGTSSGPFPVEENGANNSAIPGVVLALGRRAYAGDIMAVVITRRREESAREYGGRWELSLDLEVMARDVHAQGEISDRTLMYLQSELRDRLSFEGIEIDQVSSGGESEEQYDGVGDDFFYNTTISITLMSDWSAHLPLGGSIRRIVPGSVLSDQIAMSPGGILQDGVTQMTGYQSAPSLGLTDLQDPWFSGRSHNFEMIR